MTPHSRVADVGAGTGLSAEPFLRFGCPAFGVEPNREMREAGERYLARYERYRALNGRAEATSLRDASVDVLVAGQAFHWFDIEPTRVEFARVLTPTGRVVLMWNDRRVADSPFLRDYDFLLEGLGAAYADATHKNAHDALDGRIARVLAPGFASAAFANAQRFDERGLIGRARSSSYVPQAGSPGHDAFFAALGALFARHQHGGYVEFLYDTRVYVGTSVRS